MITKKELKSRYDALSIKEKEVIGSALVKVNLGVSMPLDQRRAAEFLKGSVFIAKAGELDAVIQLLHDDHLDEASDMNSTQEILVSLDEGIDEDEAAKTLKSFAEDTVVTVTDRLRDYAPKKKD